MTFYSVMAYDIVDRAKFEEAMKGGSVAKAMVEELGARRLASGGVTPAKGQWDPHRLNIIEWPDKTAFEKHLADLDANRMLDRFGLRLDGIVTVEADQAKPAKLSARSRRQAV